MLERLCRSSGLAFTICVALSAWSTMAEPPAAPRGLDALRVPDGFEISIAAGPELAAYPMFMEFDEQGRLFVAESTGKDLSGKAMAAEPECLILRLEDTDRDGVYDTRTVFADTLSLPMGVLWHQGYLYAASPPDFIRFRDTTGDGIADEREVLLTGWNILNTASLHGPYLGPDGWLYLTHGRHGYTIESKEGAVFEGLAPRIWRCRPDGTQLERFAGGGFDNPIELVWLPGGDMIGTMTYFTDPKLGERDGLLHFVEGGVYPKPHPSVSEFVRTGELMPVMTKFARIAPSGLARYEGEAFGAEYEGNLFSAQFNPHRVQRHILIDDRSSYRTIDSDFLTSLDPDFHPTDVIEDADGSLLVSDTGAWYVDACPISRVARPEIKGTIYRIRKNGAPAVHDAWGRQIHIATLDPASLVRLLDDHRPKVRAQSRERLAERGAQSIPALRGALHHASEDVREQAAWLLGRLGDAPGLDEAMRDSHPRVRMAAAEVAGYLENADTTQTLISLLYDETPGVIRTAATALGRLGHPESISTLLEASADPADRFVEHALIFALIRIEQPDAVRPALAHEAPGVRKAALIALDQMDADLLDGTDIVPFLNADNDALRDTGLWVASRHPEWSDVVAEYLREALPSAGHAGEAAHLRNVMFTFAGDANVQGLVGDVLGSGTIPVETQMFLLDVIESAPIGALPDAWLLRMAEALERGNETIRWRVVRVIQRRGIPDFDEALIELADLSETPAGLRIAALEAVIQRQPALPGDRLAFLLDQLDADRDPTLRLGAGKVLARASLSTDQLRRVATETLREADALTLPFLVETVRGQDDEAVGLALIESLKASQVSPSLLSGGLDTILETFPDSVREAAAPLRAQIESESAQRIERLLALEPKVYDGDVGRGRRVFYGEKAACGTCHAVGHEGGELGPDLTRIGAIRSSHDLLEAVLFPSASMVPGYETYRVETDDDVHGGILTEETADAIVLMTGVDAAVRIPRSAIQTMALSPVSIMPEGLDTALTEDELIDLMAFLLSLNDEQWLLPARRDTATD